ncbi:MAG: hypothetical protein AB1540_07685 [Bdellovibrionota bacterium]
MKRSFQVILSLIAFFGIMLIMNKVRYRYDWENAFWRTIMTPMTGTIWAKDFSEAGFAKITYGMSSAEVRSLVGEPLNRECDKDGCGWSYSDQDSDTADSDRRWVRFDAKDRVDYIWHEFHID